MGICGFCFCFFLGPCYVCYMLHHSHTHVCTQYCCPLDVCFCYSWIFISIFCSGVFLSGFHASWNPSDEKRNTSNFESMEFLQIFVSFLSVDDPFIFDFIYTYFLLRFLISSKCVSFLAKIRSGLAKLKGLPHITLESMRNSQG